MYRHVDFLETIILKYHHSINACLCSIGCQSFINSLMVLCSYIAASHKCTTIPLSKLYLLAALSSLQIILNSIVTAYFVGLELIAFGLLITPSRCFQL